MLRVDDTDGVQTMPSLAMVDYINVTRKPGVPELQHFSFMAKVPLALKDASNFLSVYLGPNGEQRPCYNLPEQEAMFMGYVLQLPVTGYGVRRMATSHTKARLRGLLYQRSI